MYYWENKRGEPILRAEDGFIIKGNVYVAVPTYEKGIINGGGLIGRTHDVNIPFSQIPLDIFSKEQLLKTLLCTPEELREIADIIEKERT